MVSVKQQPGVTQVNAASHGLENCSGLVGRKDQSSSHQCSQEAFDQAVRCNVEDLGLDVSFSQTEQSLHYCLHLMGKKLSSSC